MLTLCDSSFRPPKFQGAYINGLGKLFQICFRLLLLGVGRLLGVK